VVVPGPRRLRLPPAPRWARLGRTGCRRRAARACRPPGCLQRRERGEERERLVGGKRGKVRGADVRDCCWGIWWCPALARGGGRQHALVSASLSRARPRSARSCKSTVVSWRRDRDEMGSHSLANKKYRAVKRAQTIKKTSGLPLSSRSRTCGGRGRVGGVHHGGQRRYHARHGGPLHRRGCTRGGGRGRARLILLTRHYFWSLFVGYHTRDEGAVAVDAAGLEGKG
jgi:hypothetical protein